MGRLIAIGDVHGCLNTLQSLLKRLNLNKKSDELVFLGDYIDRGRYSCETIEFLIGLQKEMGEDNCTCLMGNHEYMMIEAIKNRDRTLWKQNGANKTISSYHKDDKRLNSHLWWLSKLPFVLETDGYFFCHAGLPHEELKDNTVDDILWDRTWIHLKKEPSRKTVVFGHTPCTAGYYATESKDICIDAGCVYGGFLCAMVIEGESVSFVMEPSDSSDIRKVRKKVGE